MNHKLLKKQVDILEFPEMKNYVKCATVVNWWMDTKYKNWVFSHTCHTYDQMLTVSDTQHKRENYTYYNVARFINYELAVYRLEMFTPIIIACYNYLLFVRHSACVVNTVWRKKILYHTRIQ